MSDEESVPYQRQDPPKPDISGDTEAHLLAAADSDSIPPRLLYNIILYYLYILFLICSFLRWVLLTCGKCLTRFSCDQEMEDFSNFPFCHALIRILQVIFLFLVAFEKEAPSLLSELEKVLL